MSQRSIRPRDTCLVLLVLTLLCGELYASETVYGQTVSQMRHLQDEIMVYRHYRGEYPVTDEQSTWFEKLVSFFGNDMAQVHTTPDGSLPVDAAGNTFIYELPGGQEGDPEHRDELPVLRWVGYNGVDNKGKLDDWDLRFGPNIGYYYKAGYPKAIMAAKIHGVLTIFLLIPVLCICKGWRIRSALILLWFGTGTSVMGHLGTSFHCKGCSIFEPFFNGGLFAILVGLVLAAATIVDVAEARRARSLIDGASRCPSCGYDRRSGRSTTCPECGLDQSRRRMGSELRS